MENMKEFEQLVAWFKESKYADFLRVRTDDEPLYHCAVIQTENLLLAFCNKHDEYALNANSLYINGRVAMEHGKLFDKWSKCLFYVFLPTTKQEFDGLLEMVEYISGQYYDDYMAECDASYEQHVEEHENFIEDFFNKTDNLKAVKHLVDWEL